MVVIAITCVCLALFLLSVSIANYDFVASILATLLLLIIKSLLFYGFQVGFLAPSSFSNGSVEWTSGMEY